jgi:GNAT superfamily N-acetyltransferase
LLVVPYRISKVDPTDDEIEETIRDLHKATFGNNAPMVDPWAFGHWWLAYCSPRHRGDGPVAFAGLQRHEDDTGYLKRCGVLSCARGNGLQRKLITVRERYARRLGYTHLVSDTTNAIASSNNLIKAGYRLFIPKDPWGPNGALYWRKEL